MEKRPEIKRILLKVSGEVFGGQGESVDFEKVTRFAEEMRSAKETGVEIAVVIGGGNILRGGVISELSGVDRVTADYMGMLGTIINALALQSALENIGVKTSVMTAITMEELVQPYIRRNALNHLDEGLVVILAGGTGNPYFTTDTAAALRAVEIKADVLCKGTKVDGIYTADPKEIPDAEMISNLTFTEVLKEDLRVMDATAVALCRENSIPIIVFNILRDGNLKRVLQGEDLGTIVQ